MSSDEEDKMLGKLIEMAKDNTKINKIVSDVMMYIKKNCDPKDPTNKDKANIVSDVFERILTKMENMVNDQKDDKVQNNLFQAHDKLSIYSSSILPCEEETKEEKEQKAAEQKGGKRKPKAKSKKSRKSKKTSRKVKKSSRKSKKSSRKGKKSRK
jgi:hypothetical protein